MSVFTDNTIIPKEIRTTNRSPTVDSDLLPVPVDVKQFILSNYAVDRNSTMFILADQPQRPRFVESSGTLADVPMVLPVGSPTASMNYVLHLSSFNGTGGVISNEPHREQCRDQMKVRCSELPLDLQTGEGQRILNSISLAEQRGKRKVENALSKKSVEVQASVNPSHLPLVRTGGSVSPVGVLTDMLNNCSVAVVLRTFMDTVESCEQGKQSCASSLFRRIFDEEHNAFSQSCFARINSPS
ncbi:unnamed protein product [Toxocara canis]|uniref:Uncharacterized protein n=1 Tax=Toxocara canis TaxID=6265 RepID=A0A183UZX6_TOXCA|nr:unnamed protein product [Toxocara canis]